MEKCKKRHTATRWDGDSGFFIADETHYYQEMHSIHWGNKLFSINKFYILSETCSLMR
jgi:hypothetical protein